MNETVVREDPGTAPSRLSFARFMVTSRTLTLPALTQVLGRHPDRGWSLGDSNPRPNAVVPQVRSFTNWTRDSGVEKGFPIRLHLDALYPRVMEVASRLNGRDDVDCGLQIVQYFESEREIGFHLERSWIELLGSIGASIDVDQYA